MAEGAISSWAIENNRDSEPCSSVDCISECSELDSVSGKYQLVRIKINLPQTS